MKKIWLLFLTTLAWRIVFAQPELIYHVFQRSFFDSNGDRHGDLRGLRGKLDYLQDLGVTSILLTPLYVSDFYHNYFARDFSKIDAEYGSLKDYLDLVRELHRRKMKIYQDVEMQYVTAEHPWFTQSFQHPESAFSQYIYYLDQENRQPWWLYGIPEFTTYDHQKQQIAVVNLNHPGVKEYTLETLSFWVDPDGDGDFEDGVDGFRLDHAMDDLDNAGKLTGLLAGFWMPLLDSLRRKNPALSIVAEQANWNDYGDTYFSKGKVDRVFAFRLWQAICSLDKEKILQAADSSFRSGMNQVVFIENHDTRRFASTVSGGPARLRLGAALNLLIGGTPAIYYGQEIGMQGQQLSGPTDGNDIPVREAFDWYRQARGKGMADWYRNTGPWWENRFTRASDGVSVEEEQNDPHSLLSYYKTLINLRRRYPALATGSYRPVPNQNPFLLSFERVTSSQTLLILINLAGNDQRAELEIAPGASRLIGEAQFSSDPGRQSYIQLPPYDCSVLVLKP